MKKKTVHQKKSAGKTKPKQKRMFHMRFTYVAYSTFALILFFSATSLVQVTESPTSVLGASTTTSQQGGFSFGNFFNSLFSFFTGHFTSSTSQNTNSNNTTMGNYAGSSSLQTTTNTTQVTLTQAQVDSLASNKYADGNLPLGDGKYVTSGPKQGYIYLCQLAPGGGGAQVTGNWIHGTTWNINEKIAVEGNVNWSNHSFTEALSGSTRTVSGNDLPSHTTGVFPIQATDPAYAYDKNPNLIKTQSFTDMLPANPSYSDTPYCMNGEVGVMTTGVVLFNGFDAEYRDAAANEVQDSCNGHPQESGEYHYHALSSCITDVDETNVIGYALDGFPITGPKVGTDKYLTTANLDECHGITSQIMLDGKLTTTYHYVMTQDFPYSVSCFRGKPIGMQVISTSNGQNKVSSGSLQSQVSSGTGQSKGAPQGGMMGSNQKPPQAAITACSGKTSGTTCSFSGMNGMTITGTCKTPPNQSSGSLACVPANAPMMQGGMSGQGIQQSQVSSGSEQGGQMMMQQSQY